MTVYHLPQSYGQSFMFKLTQNEPPEKWRHHMMGLKEHIHSNEMVKDDEKGKLSIYA